MLPLIGGINPTAFKLHPLCREASISSGGGHTKVTSVRLSLKVHYYKIQKYNTRNSILKKAMT